MCPYINYNSNINQYTCYFCSMISYHPYYDLKISFNDLAECTNLVFYTGETLQNYETELCPTLFYQQSKTQRQVSGVLVAQP